MLNLLELKVFSNENASYFSWPEVRPKSIIQPISLRDEAQTATGRTTRDISYGDRWAGEIYANTILECAYVLSRNKARARFVYTRPAMASI